MSGDSDSINDSDNDLNKRIIAEKVCLYVLGAAQDLRDAGLIEGHVGGYLRPSGIFRYDQLRASGYRPSSREIEMAIIAFAKASGASPPPEVIELIKKHARDEIGIF